MATTTTKSSPNITRYQDWEVAEANFEFMNSAVKTQSGGLASGFKYKGGKLFLKTPRMRASFGLQAGMNGDGYNLQVNFDETEACQQLLAKFNALDELVLQAGLQRAATWFPLGKNGKPVPSAVIEEKHYPMVKPSKDPKYHPSLRIKLPCSTKIVNNAQGEPEEKEVFDCRLFDANKNQLEINDENLPGGCYVSMLIAVSSIWSTTTGFGATLKASQIMVFNNDAQRLPAHCLLDIDSDDDTAGAAGVEGQTTAAETLAALDSDEELDTTEPVAATATGEEVEDAGSDCEIEPEPVVVTTTKKAPGRPKQAATKK